MSGGENVPVGDEDAAAVLIVAVAQQGGHPRPFALVGRFAADDARVDVDAVLAAARTTADLLLGRFRRRTRRYRSRCGGRQLLVFLVGAAHTHVTENRRTMTVRNRVVPWCSYSVLNMFCA